MSDPVLGVASDPAPADASLLRSGFCTEVTSQNGFVVLGLHGELDMATAPELGHALSAALDGQPSSLTLDLTELTFVDSTGIRVLITGSRRAASEGCSFTVRHPRRSVLKALRLTGVDRLMVIEVDPPTV